MGMEAAMLNIKPFEEMSKGERQDYFAEFTPFGYTEADLLEFFGVHNDVDTLVLQALGFAPAIREAMAASIPAKIPVLMLRSDLTEELEALEEREAIQVRKTYELEMAAYRQRFLGDLRWKTISGSSHQNIYHQADAVKEIEAFLAK